MSNICSGDGITVTFRVQGLDLDSLLVTPQGIAFLAALNKARAARRVLKRRRKVYTAAREAWLKAYESLRASEEGEKARAATQIEVEHHEAVSKAKGRYLEAEAQVCLARLLGRDETKPKEASTSARLDLTEEEQKLREARIRANVEDLALRGLLQKEVAVRVKADKAVQFAERRSSEIEADLWGAAEELGPLVEVTFENDE